jgi:glycyl-tRNA synthetase alpha subunit
MAEKLDTKELVTAEELLMSEIIQSEALINLLDRKGIISKKELLEEIRRVKAIMDKTKDV